MILGSVLTRRPTLLLYDSTREDDLPTLVVEGAQLQAGADMLLVKGRRVLVTLHRGHVYELTTNVVSLSGYIAVPWGPWA